MMNERTKVQNFCEVISAVMLISTIIGLCVVLAHISTLDKQDNKQTKESIVRYETTIVEGTVESYHIGGKKHICQVKRIVLTIYPHDKNHIVLDGDIETGSGLKYFMPTFRIPYREGKERFLFHEVVKHPNNDDKFLIDSIDEVWIQILMKNGKPSEIVYDLYRHNRGEAESPKPIASFGGEFQYNNKYEAYKNYWD